MRREEKQAQLAADVAAKYNVTFTEAYAAVTAAEKRRHWRPRSWWRWFWGVRR